MNDLTEDQRHQLPKDGGDNYNRLIFEDSVYLRHHAHQKINWYPWGQDAFDLAKITDKPLFLSIGYSSCHWCHVMSETTFDHPDVAKALNEHFVAVKIDRDALPDIDQVYMAATQLLTQHGGWPNSVFCLPTGQPFYAGTYFPADDGPKGRGFLTILDQLAQAWQHRRAPLQQQAQELERVIKKMNTLVKDSVQSLTLRRSFDATMQSISATFDSTYGGFGGAPKFPPYATLRLLLARGNSGDLAMVNTTLIAMATSSLYDHVAGGFHRYSTDAEWHLPHFEKMLSDNAQMIEIYSLAHEQCPDPLYERVVTETIAHMQDTWALGDGAYLATIDADTTDGEGYYYTMSMPELVSLGTPDQVADWARHYQYTDEGNMYDEATGQPTGQNMCHPLNAEDPMDRDVFRHNARLFRQKHREAPLKDTRMIPSANALLAKAFLIAGRVFCQSEWQRLGDDLIDYLMMVLDRNMDALYLDDVVYLLDAVLTQGGNNVHVTKLWGTIMDRFYDHGAGGAWFTQEAQATPISRIKD
ncbi:MAG: thioredoxin domain-containing protein, partial [Candidatus Marinamargulisbacteria bacterium]